MNGVFHHFREHSGVTVSSEDESYSTEMLDCYCLSPPLSTGGNGELGVSLFPPFKTGGRGELGVNLPLLLRTGGTGEVGVAKLTKGVAKTDAITSERNVALIIM